MFTFFNRKSEIVIDCFTNSANAYDMAPIEKAVKVFPEWWKKLPLVDSSSIHITEHAGLQDKNKTTLNMKRCFGFTELFKRSLVLESWADYNISCTQENLIVSYSDKSARHSGFSSHPPISYDGGFKSYYHLKFNSPWLLKEKNKEMFITLGAEWHLEDYLFRVMPGCLEFRTQHQLNVNAFLNKKDYCNTSIKTGQPLLYLLPLSDKKIKIKNHLITKQEYEKLDKTPSFFGFNHLIKTQDKVEARKSKCPFHFN